MGWAEEQIPDFIFMTLYSYILIRMITSADPYFRTTFFILFISTGICGVLSVATHIIAAKIIYPESMGMVLKAVWTLNRVGAFGSTAGKLLIVIHRYTVLRNVEIIENNWTGLFLKVLLLAQFTLPLTTAVPLICANLSTITRGDISTIENLDKEAIVINKLITTGVYLVFIILSIILTILTWFKFSVYSSLVQDNLRRDILGQQRRMFLIVVLCTLGHLVKAIHQFGWAFLSYMDMMELANAIWPFYPYANGLATYTAPITLILISKRVRHLLIFRHTIIPVSSSVYAKTQSQGTVARQN